MIIFCLYFLFFLLELPLGIFNAFGLLGCLISPVCLCFSLSLFVWLCVYVFLAAFSVLGGVWIFCMFFDGFLEFSFLSLCIVGFGVFLLYV